MTAAPFSHAQSEEHVAEVPDAVANAGVFERNVRKRARMMRELESLNEDNAGKRDRDQMAIWRKIQTFISRNDDIANEYVMIQLLTFH
jgi:hypothetical protein